MQRITLGEKTEAAFRAAPRYLEVSPSDSGVLGGLLEKTCSLLALLVRKRTVDGTGWGGGTLRRENKVGVERRKELY